MFRHEFLPAIIPYVTEPYESIGHGLNRERRPWRAPIHWLDPDQPFYYPYALASYALWTKTAWPFKSVDGVPHQIVFGDSGGYTVVTKKASIDPTRVIEWQMRNCTRGLMLDIPPYRSEGIQFSGSAAQHWEDSIRRTLRNVERALPLYNDFDAPHFSWWGAVQGETRDQMQEWWERVSSIYSFQVHDGEGWALAPKPSTDILSCTRYLAFARDNSLKRIHFLQVTSVRALAVIFSLAHMCKAFELITYDSASATRCAINRVAIKLDGLDQTYIKQEGNGEGEVTEYLMKLDHPAAEFYKKYYPLTNAEWPHFVLLYNHRVMLEGFNRLYEAAKDDPEKVIKQFLPSSISMGKVMREFEGVVSHAKPQGRKVSILQRIR